LSTDSLISFKIRISGHHFL